MQFTSPIISHSNDYRADIDGLRALSVMLVVGFHAFPSRITGGFIGVDIFFVISGFLISTIIFNKLSNNSFSIMEFYTRRIKRIFPALITVLASCFILGWFALFSDEYKQLGKHIVASSGFISNIIFWQESGYFDNSAITKPLLHLWSLGIEEQFYVIWPLILYLSWKKNFSLFKVTLLFTLFSFSTNIYTLKNDPTATFFLPHTRVWELLCGSLLAWFIIHYKDSLFTFSQNKQNFISQNSLRHFISIIGLCSILLGVKFLTKDDNFPGWLPLLPIFGAICIIYAGPNACLNKLLSHKAVVWIGLISFPLYLWHWPILSFCYIINSKMPSALTRIIAIIISIILSWLTYKIIETPIRLRTDHNVIKFLLSAMVCLSLAGLIVFQYNGLESRLHNVTANTRLMHPTTAIQQDTSYTTNEKFNNFFNTTPIKSRDFLIEKLAGNTTNSIAILGDSHANKLYLGTQKYSDLKLINIGRGTCPPLLGIEVHQQNGDTYKCQPLTDNYLKFIKHDQNVTVIVLNAFFNYYLKDEVFLTKYGKKIDLATALNDTVKYLSDSNKVVVVATDVPEIHADCYPKNTKRKLPIWQTVTHSDPQKCFISLQDQIQMDANIISKLMNHKSFPKLVIFYSRKALCSDDTCGEIDAQNYLYSTDGNHLNDYGIEKLGMNFSSFLQETVEKFT